MGCGARRERASERTTYESCVGVVVQHRVHDFGEFGTLHEWLLWGPAVGSRAVVAAVDLEAFEHGGVEQLAGAVV
ncbi:hypothetical protein A5630_18860 [Mycolicibacterium mucogenicum]|uniref:Uncharacterized protein n=1 Tax=Mycolicibacterium mucogenicum TaxID=56689 RepID=A0A1A3H691_MYCMU|nr:hypothetical protein A5630_18860 [Mycolicibacterium mucogenicum]